MNSVADAGSTVAWAKALISGTRAVRALLPKPVEMETVKYAYYPKQWQPPYIDRRRNVGWDLYTLLGIGKTDKQRMQVQHLRKVEFFGTPVSRGSWLDYQMYLQNVMLAAECMVLRHAQAAAKPFHSVLQDILKWSDAETLVCRMAMGFEDHQVCA